METQTKALLTKLMKFGVAVGLIAWMINKGLLDLSSLGQLLTPVHVCVALTLLFLNIYINNYRWSLLLASQDLPARLVVTFPLTLVGLFFNFAVPGAVGGDVVKAYYVAQDHPKRRMAAATTVMMDRIVGLYAMILLAVVTMLLNLETVWHRIALRNVFFSSLLLILLMTIVLGLIFSSAVKTKNPLLRWSQGLPGGDFLNRFYEALHSYGKNLRTVLLTIAISIIGQMIAIGYMAYIGFALGENVPLATYFFAVPLGFIVMALPISPAGIGVGQVAFLVLFRMFTGSETTVGQTVITVFQIGMLSWSLIGAFIYAQRKKPKILDEATSA